MSAVVRRPICGSSWLNANMTWQTNNFLSLKIKETEGLRLRCLLVLTLARQLLGRSTVIERKQENLTFNSSHTMAICGSRYTSASSTKLFLQRACASAVYWLHQKLLQARSKGILPAFLLFPQTFPSKSTQPKYTYVSPIGTNDL